MTEQTTRYPRHSIGRDKAIALHDAGWWKTKTAREIARFQMATEELCLPFEEFHKAMEEAIGRPVWTHEFGLNYDGLCAELYGDATTPSFGEIVGLIPADKLLVVAVELTEQPRPAP